MRTYSSFGLRRTWYQVRAALAPAEDVEVGLRQYLDYIEADAREIERLLGGPLRGRRVLEVGPGQNLVRALYFARQNEVTAIDLDVILDRFSPRKYLAMFRTNGAARAAKTIGRQVLMAPRGDGGLRRMLGVRELPRPQLLQGDIGEGPPEREAFDAAVSWSVFEHLPDPERALSSMVAALRPGGVLFVSIHLYTANNGHHDIRSFTGRGEELPLWAHLRESTQEVVEPSAYLNEWRLERWRELFDRLAPGHEESLEQYEHPEVLGPQLTPELRCELCDYSDDELFTVNLVFRWRKPKAGPADQPEEPGATAAGEISPATVGAVIR